MFSPFTPSKPSSALQQTLSSPLYRGATLVMFLSGLGTSAAAPQIVLFLVRELRTPLPLAGLYYLTSLAAPLAGYLVGSRSDRTGERLGLFRRCALAGFVGWAAIALSTQRWMPFLISALILPFSGAAISQLFAAVRDDLDQEPQGSSESVVAIIRMALTAGWVIGPVLGAWLAAATGLRALLWMTALCALAQLIPLGTLEPTVRGAVIGIQPLVELAIMPFSVVLGRRVGLLWLMCIGAAFGVAANVCFATTGSAAGMFAGQILMGGVWGIFASLGIIAAQRLLPSAVATASAIFLSSTAVSSALGGLTGGLGVALVGLPAVFFIPAAFAFLAVIGLMAMARSGVLRSRPTLDQR